MGLNKDYERQNELGHGSLCLGLLRSWPLLHGMSKRWASSQGPSSQPVKEDACTHAGLIAALSYTALTLSLPLHPSSISPGTPVWPRLIHSGTAAVRGNSSSGWAEDLLRREEVSDMMTWALASE